MGIEVGAMVALQAAGAATSAMGAYKQAKGQQAVLGYQAAVAENNAKIADEQARIALENGAAMEQASRLKTAALRGDQRAALAASGVDLGQGSAVEIISTTDYMGERDALTIRDNASRQAWASRNNAASYRSEAAFDMAMRSSISPATAAFTSLLGSASSASRSWYGWDKATAPKGG